MIKTFKHKGLEKYFHTGSKQGIKPEHASKIARVLDRLDASVDVKDMNLSSYRLHKLTGKDEGTWSVWINGNWRITFTFQNGNAYIVDYRDYH